MKIVAFVILGLIFCVIYGEKLLGTIVSKIVDLYSVDSTRPFIPLHRISLEDIRSNLKIIKKEILNVTHLCTSIQGDLYFGSDITNDGKWKKIYLKWYHKSPGYAYRLLPETMRIIDRHPDIRLAMISKLDPGAHIMPHRGVYRGSIRVHVGISTPNSPDCFIHIGNMRYYWKDDDIVAFDDTYIHEVFNNSSKPRIILFMDIDRKMSNCLARGFLHLISTYICPLTSRVNKELVTRSF